MWSLTALCGIWIYTEFRFRVDPISYVRYPLARVATFPAFDGFAHQDQIPGLKFSEDSENLFIQRSRAWLRQPLTRWGIDEKSVVWIFDSNPDEWTPNFAVSDDQRLFIIASEKASIQVRDIKTGKIRKTLIRSDGQDSTAHLQSSQSNQLVADPKTECGSQQMDYSTQKNSQLAASGADSFSVVHDQPAATSPDGLAIACLRSFFSSEGLWQKNDIEVVETATGQTLLTVENFDDSDEIAFSPNRQTLATSMVEGHIALYKFRAGGSPEPLVIQNYGREFTFAADGRSIIGVSHEGAIARFDTSSGQKNQQILPADPTLANVGHSLRLSDDGSTLLTTGSVVEIWDNRDDSPDLLHTVPIAHPVGQGKPLVSPNGDRFAFGGDTWRRLERDEYASSVVIGSVKTGQVTHTLQADSTLYDFAFSDDAKLLATIHRDRTANVWSTETGILLHTLSLASADESKPSRLGRITFGTDNTLLTADDYAVQLWNARTGERFHTLAASDIPNATSWKGTGEAFAMSPDGALAIGTGRDRKVYVWDTKTGRLLRIFYARLYDPRGFGKPKSLTFSPDGKRLASGDHQNRITVWQLPNRFSW